MSCTLIKALETKTTFPISFVIAVVIYSTAINIPLPIIRPTTEFKNGFLSIQVSPPDNLFGLLILGSTTFRKTWLLLLKLIHS